MSGNEGTERAFVLRIRPSGVDRVQDALASDELIIGWSESEGLLNPDLTWREFRQVIHDTHYASKDDYRRSGRAAGEMWRFIREMQPGSLVVVPHGSKFYVAEVAGSAARHPDKVAEDTAHRRPVRWLNDKKPIPRSQVPAGLYARMKIRGTSADASEFVEDIRDVIERQKSGSNVTFDSDLHETLIAATVERLRQGFVNEREFERVIKAILERMGAERAQIVEARQNDEGADVLATFRLGRTTEVRLAVQAKFYKPVPPVGPRWVDQLRDGMVAEGADIGWLATTGTFSEEVEERREELLESEGVRIDLVDAEDLATMIVDNGVSPPDL